MITAEHYELAGKVLSRFNLPDDIREKVKTQIAREIELRDKQWNRAIAAPAGQPMPPKAAAKWLETDRRRQVNEVVAARVRRGPVRW